MSKTTESDNLPEGLFRPGAGAYAREEAASILRFALPVIALILLASFIAGVYDARYIIVGLMILFIAAPMAVFMVWLKMTSRTDILLRLRPQRWSIDKEKRTLNIELFSFKVAGDISDKESPADIPKPDKIIVIPLDMLERIDSRKDRLIIRSSLQGAHVLIAEAEHISAENVKILNDAVFNNQSDCDDEISA